MSQRIRTVVIPAAGQGTRLLPLTKTVPKELLPVYDRPVLQFALAEALAVGAERIVIVIHPSKTVIRDYVRPDFTYIETLQDKGKHDLAAALSELHLPANIDVVFAIQTEALGLGHAISCARGQLLPGPFGVILPDDVILGAPCLLQMAQHYKGGHMVAAMDVSASDTSRYGIFKPTASAFGQCVPVDGMVEKPKPGTAPSRLAAVGRYILDPQIVQTLAETPEGAGGEIQLTDAIARDAATLPLTAFRFTGTRYDCGTHDGLIEAAAARQVQVKRSRTSALTAAQ
jgi:UTP--glucose-1-phosphate uridylyltransferase